MNVNDCVNLGLKASCPNNEIMFDNLGRPSVMVRIPKFKIKDVIYGGSDDVHPAFIVNGREIPEIYVSKYQNVVQKGLAYSLPDERPGTDISFDEALKACQGKGPGWHLMTNAEWSAIALWSRRNNTMPRGNNDFGKDIRESTYSAAPATFEANGAVACVRTGTGPTTWSHNGQVSGVWDLNGNVAEWLGGFRIVCGELQVIKDNDAAMNVDQSQGSALWRAVSVDGRLIEPMSSESLKLDFINGRWTITTEILSSVNETRACTFESAAADIRVPELLKALAVYPADSGDHGLNYFYANNGAPEIMTLRGSHWNRGTNCGIFALYMCQARDFRFCGAGFRSAYIPNKYVEV